MPLHSVLRSSARFATLLSCCLSLIALRAAGADLKPAESNSNAPDPLAVLEAHCVKCHGGEKTQGGLDLVTREALLRGGESGADVVPGKPDASLLIRQVRHEEDPHMPHKKPKLPDAAIAQLTEWVKAGVPYPRALAKNPQADAKKDAQKFALTDADRIHWAFQPIEQPTVPAVKFSVLSPQ